MTVTPIKTVVGRVFLAVAVASIAVCLSVLCFAGLAWTERVDETQLSPLQLGFGCTLMLAGFAGGIVSIVAAPAALIVGLIWAFERK